MTTLDDSSTISMSGLVMREMVEAGNVGFGSAASTSLFLIIMLSAVVFLGAEILAPTLGLWEPVGDTHRWAGMALYVVPAEAALGWAAATAYSLSRRSPLLARVGAALAVSTFYLGALVMTYFVVDVATWRLTT